MPIVSITRLHLRGARFFPSFLLYSFRSTGQVRRAAGFRAGWLGHDDQWGFWTATVWDSAEAMRDYRNAPPHLTAMKKLLHWCDEASYTHWEAEGIEPPDGETAFRRLREAGRLSKVLNPSERQRAGRTVGDSSPRTDRPLRPK